MPDGRDNDKQCPNAFPLTSERIYASTVDDPQMFNLRVGTIRQRAQLPPRIQFWCRSALPWVKELDSVAELPTQPPM
jgi:hypothetical protein